jgi:predicted phosphate transport protein (TIGR00153 family)
MQIFPKNIDFFKLFEEQVAELQKAVKVFSDYEAEDNIKKQSIRIKKIEHAADEITHKIIKTLNQTFITPIDREDITSLASHLDDIVDVMDMAMSRLYIYKIDVAPREIFQYAHLAEKAISEIAKGVRALSNKKGLNEVLKHTEFVNFIENQADEYHRKTLENLFENEKDPIMIIKMKEIYELLERITDRCEDAANSLETIVVKNQ